jgi:hypothetical protein
MPRSKKRPGPDAPAPRTVAERLIEYLGEQAPCHATFMAFKARERGDRSRMNEWLWIAGATRQILRSEP